MVQNLEEVNKNLQEQPQNYINDIRPPEMRQNTWDLSNVWQVQPTNTQPAQPASELWKIDTWVSQIQPLNAPSSMKIEAPTYVDPKTWLAYDENKQLYKGNGKMEEVKAPVSSLFGYSTTPEEREKRNLQLAQGIIWKTQDFNKNRAFLEKTIRSYAPNVTDADIQNTIGDIENKFNTLKKNKLLTEKIWTAKATDLVNQTLTDEEINYLKTSDPNKYNEYIKAKDIKDYNDMLNWKKADLPIMDIPETPTLDLAKIRSEIYDTPDFKASKTALIDKKAKLDEIQDQIDSTMKEVENQFKGTWATRWEILRESNRRIEAATDIYKQAKREYDKALSTYTMFKDEADTKYDTRLKQYELNRQATQDKIDNFKLQYGIYKDQQALETAKKEREDKWDMLYAQQDFAREQATTAFEQKYGNIESKDPNMQKLAVDNAISDIMEQYKGWTFSRSKQQMVDDVLKLVKQGKTLWQALWDNITWQLQKNPNFTKWLKSNNTINKDDYIEYDIRDEDGNITWTWLYNKFDKTTIVLWQPSTIQTTWDLRWLASQFPWQAWAKNNNPAWITWNSNFDKWLWTAKLLKEAWINYSKWTARPSGEWWNYVTFDTIEDWLKAQQIMMTQTYWNSTVWQMLSKWVWTSEWPNYAKQVAWNAWVDINSKVKDLTPEQLNSLQLSKIQKESPWLYWLLTKKGWVWAEEKKSYLERMKFWWLTPSEYWKIQKIASKWWWLDEYNQALKKGMLTNLTPVQQKAYETLVDDIQGSSIYKDMKTFQNSLWVVKTSLQQDSWLGDIAAINALQRMIDPWVSVREWDVSLIQSSIPLTWKLDWNYWYWKAKSWDKLPAELRAQMKKLAEDIYRTNAENYNSSSAILNRNRASAIWIDKTLVPWLEFPLDWVNVSPDKKTYSSIADFFTNKFWWVIKKNDKVSSFLSEF